MGDVGSPFTWQHNRAKKQCAHRAVLIARGLIYAETGIVYRGPDPHSVTVDVGLSGLVVVDILICLACVCFLVSFFFPCCYCCC